MIGENKSPGFEAGAKEISWRTGRNAAHNCPYLCKTARQGLPTRQLCAASVEPQRTRLFHVMPPWRSQNLAAAGLQGASSARSIAPVLDAQTPSHRLTAMSSFMVK
jgi:hypothetical protein